MIKFSFQYLRQLQVVICRGNINSMQLMHTKYDIRNFWISPNNFRVTAMVKYIHHDNIELQLGNPILVAIVVVACLGAPKFWVLQLSNF